MDELLYANVWERIAGAQPERPAVIQGAWLTTWAEFDARADALAADLLEAGLGQGAKVAAYLYNSAAYLETYYAAFKAGLAPINTNYRYGADELFYLFDNADAEAIVFHAGFAATLDPIRTRLTKVKRFIAVPDPGYDIPDWAVDYEAVAATTPANRPVVAPWGRSGDDLLLLYTGGTTGMPKGVMWRQGDLFPALGGGGNALIGVEPYASLEEIPRRIADPGWLRPVGMTPAPLMHGTGQFGALGTLSAGGAVALLPSRRFSAEELWGEVERTRATRIGIVGLAFSAPMLEVLDVNPGRWDLSSVRLIGSSGSMWSYENKQGLLRHMPGAMLVDSFSSSEALGMGASQSTAGGEAQTARFVVGPNAAVFTEDGRRVAPGSGERGLVAVAGFQPLGYYKDPEKTAKTFPIIEGKRWCVPGDWATVNEDGTLNLLGRGSVCINTGGEKVFPEEVEEALKRHPAVRDAVVVGLPDVRFGERICAVVELVEGVAEPSLGELSAHVKDALADYKAPRTLVVVDSVGRAPNGKVDYKGVKARALSAVG
jgi:fatty-acyl-CoA synthase